MKYLIVLFLIYLAPSIYAQNTADNLDKYWTYRDRLRKKFLKAGNGPGESLPMSARSIGFPYFGGDNQTSRVYWQDTDIYLGHYLSVLAAETKLLLNAYNGATDISEKQLILTQLEQSKNELYYAIQTVNRLDLWAENYLSENSDAISSNDVNGLVLRDDVPFDFYFKFQNDYSPIFNRDCNFVNTDSGHSETQQYNRAAEEQGTLDNCYSTQARPAGFHSEYQCNNVMSIDQVTTLLSGLVMVHKLVPQGYIVQPTLSDQPIDLKEEARNIAIRIIGYMIREVPEYCENCVAINIQNWDGLFRPIGSDATFLAPFIVKLGLALGEPRLLQMQANNEFEDLIIAYQMNPQDVKDFNLPVCDDAIDDECDNKINNHEPYSIAKIPYKTVVTILDAIENQNVDISIEGDPCFTLTEELDEAIESINIDFEDVGCDNFMIGLGNVITSIIFHERINGIPGLFLRFYDGIAQESSVCINDIAGDGNVKIDEDNVHIILELASISNYWGEEFIETIATGSNLPWYTLMQAVLHNDIVPYNSSLSLAISAEYLNTAPCEGPWDDPNTPTNTGSDYVPQVGTTPGWCGANRLFHNGDAYRGIPDPSMRGEFSGLDYMLYYNLHHLLWPQNLPTYKRHISCNCIEEVTDATSIENSFLVQRKFPDYLDKGIPIESYLAHDLVVGGSSTILDVKNDFVICSPADGISTTLTINNGAELKLYDGNTLTIRSGNKLIIDSNSSFRAGFSTPESQNAGITIATIVLEPGAELHVLNGSLFQPYAGMKIFLQQGSKFIVDNADVIFHQNSSGSGFYLEGQDTELIFQNNAVLINNSPAPTFSTLENHATLKITDSYVDMPNSVITFRDYCILNTQNSTLDFTGSAIELTNHCSHNFYHSEMNLDNSHINVLNSSLFLQIESQLSISNDGYLTFDDGEDPFSTTSTYSFYGGELILEGTDSHILFDDGKLEIAPDKTFQPTHTNTPSGYIEFTGSNEEDIFLGDNAVFKLVGDGHNDVMLKINNYHNMRNGQDGQGGIVLESCKVDLSNHGGICTDLKMNVYDVIFEDSQPDQMSDEGGYVQVWNNNTCTFFGCDFEHTDLKTYNTHLALNACNFNHRQSGVECQQGYFLLNNCSFESCHIESNGLDQFSSMANSVVHADNFGLIDESLVEIRIFQCEFNELNVGVRKTGGILSLKCCLFQDIYQAAVNANYSALNLSSDNAAGYNNFNGVGTCIELMGANELRLNHGYNNLSGYSDCCICGTMTGDFLKQTELCDGSLRADNNYWGAPGNTFPPSPQIQGIFDPSSSEVTINVFFGPCNSYCNIHGENGWQMGCRMNFYDYYPAIPTGCGTSYIFENHLRSYGLIDESTEQQYSDRLFGLDHTGVRELRNLSVDPDNPILSTISFNDMSLDSALKIAASHMEICDSLGSDALAVELFHEILSSPLDRTNSEIRLKMEWGRYNMKSAMERMFLTDELHEENNIAAFEPAVELYVDVLNAMTDTILTDSTYQSQFYLELDKGQLFRTLNNPLMAKHIYMHLDDCQLDSTEQAMLNNWRAEVDLELSLYSQSAIQYLPPDSMNFEVDTTAYTPAIPYSSSDYYFGLWIDSPTSVTFVNCGDNPVYRSAGSSSNSFTIYPNPTDGAMTIEVEQMGIYSLELFDALGRSAYKMLLNMEESTRANLQLPSSIAKGNYVIKLENSNGIYIDRLIKQ